MSGCVDTQGKPLVRKPVMYLYNFTGETQQIAIDFSLNDIADSVPEIRSDKKLIFNLDSDSSINGKYNYLYYEFYVGDRKLKSTNYAYVRNNKYLYEDLSRLTMLLGFVGREGEDFISYWELELKRIDCEYFKCEILDESKLDRLFPINIDPKPDWMIRRYVKFTAADKLAKGTITAEQYRSRPRTGSLRVFEWGGLIAEDTKVK